MYANDEETESFVASGDLSLCLGRVVAPLAANFKVGLAAANTGNGVLLNAPKDGEHASVVVEGRTMVRCGDAVTAGQYLTNAASGWAIPAAVTAGKQHVFGQARTSAASGMLAAVDLKEFYLPNSIA
jgi:hypothetical protein